MTLTANHAPNRVAILFPADAETGTSTDIMQSRFADSAKALSGTGLDVIGAPYSDAFVTEIRDRLLSAAAVLVWYNPIEANRDRSVLNAMLREVCGRGVRVSAHPDVIDRIGTKEVLFHTRHLSWGSDTKLYASTDAMRAGLSGGLLGASVRVLKQIRGQSGDGVWKVELARPESVTSALTDNTVLRVRHAKRGSRTCELPLHEFESYCRPYFVSGGMIDQPYQERLTEGMIRCYVVADRVEGFGEQLVNALYPARPGEPAENAPPPGPRLYYPPTRPDFQMLKQKLECDWIPELCTSLGIDKAMLPMLWDVDFLYGPKDAKGADTFVLCEINASSVYPFPPDAMAPLATRVAEWVRAKVG